MGVTEVAQLLGITRQHAHRVVRRADFPAPVATLASGRVWLAEDVEGWEVAHRRKPGRPETPRRGGSPGPAPAL